MGGFSEALLAFVIFALTMGGFVTLVSLLGAVSGPLLAKSLRRYGRYLQVVSGWVIVLTGAALIYASFNPGFFDSLILN